MQPTAPLTPAPRPGHFEITARDPGSRARTGCLATAHGVVETPVFMPVGTQATVKALTPRDLEEMDCRIILANTYHLNSRPGMEIIKRFGGAHRFMAWPRAMLTDSGGYQVFSLAKLRKITDEGVHFQSHIDGTRLFLGPKEAMEIQRIIGSDIAMAFDECVPYPSDWNYACQSVNRTLAWAALCAHQPRADGQLVFGIVQGGVYTDLRERCARQLQETGGFDGYAIGGVSVGEPEELILPGVDSCVDLLPADRPRYLMGVGEFWQMTEAVARGVDMFDCVMPTRLARHGTAFTRRGRFPVKAALYREDERPVEAGCGCYTCRHFSRGYIRHLLNVNEILGLHLLALHNVRRYLDFMAEMRTAIREGRFTQFREDVRATFRPDPPGGQINEKQETGVTG